MARFAESNVAGVRLLVFRRFRRTRIAGLHEAFGLGNFRLISNVRTEYYDEKTQGRQSKPEKP